MSILFALLVCIFVIAIPVLFVILIIKAIRKKPKKKTALSMLVCFVGMIVCTMIFSAIDPQSNCEHEFAVTEKVDATCDLDGKIVQKCPKCEKEITEVLPSLGHEWISANCQNPKTCQLCGLVEGKSIGHFWKEATCTSPKICTSCGLTEGDALSPNKSHVWTEATCTTPKTCTICKIVEGNTVEHIPSEWEIVDQGSSDKQGTKQQKCVVCNTIIKTEKFDSPSKIAKDIVNNAVSKFSAEAELDVIPGDAENSVVVTGAIYCENSEKTVESILAAISERLTKTSISAQFIFAIGDIADGTDGECLAMASIDADGQYSITSTSTNFKTERNQWITNQFSAWDGSHTVLKNLIKDRLNDEKSFSHIETTYIDVSTEDKKNQVNDILKQSGYSQRVSVGDLFIITKFSAKNAFNATIKNTAFGIANYSANTVSLIGIE